MCRTEKKATMDIPAIITAVCRTPIHETPTMPPKTAMMMKTKVIAHVHTVLSIPSRGARMVDAAEACVEKNIRYTSATTKIITMRTFSPNMAA